MGSLDEDYRSGFVWNGRERNTIGDLLDAVFALEDREEGQRFMDAYKAVNPHADANIGYIIGYVEPAQARERCYRLTAATHPVFGGQP